MKCILTINPNDLSENDVEHYFIRHAVRAVVLDNQNRMAILHVKKFKYYKLPGGGVEEGKSKVQALERECLEEIGSRVEIIGKVGRVIEYRCDCEMKQTSYCYLAKVKGNKGMPEFTSEEVEDGFELLWLPFEKALEKISKAGSKLPEATDFIIPRDTALLREAKARGLIFSDN